MLKVNFTHDMVFGFNGPNLCLLGSEEDFLKLPKSIIDLTGETGLNIDLLNLDFTKNEGEDKQIIFASKAG